MELADLRQITGDIPRFNLIPQAQPSQSRSRLPNVHHLAVKPQRRLHHATHADILSCAYQSIHLDGDEASERER